jgi:hypothetical protein
MSAFAMNAILPATVFIQTLDVIHKPNGMHLRSWTIPVPHRWKRTFIAEKNNHMTDRELLIRMNVFQLQQMSAIVALSGKIDCIMRKMKAKETDIQEPIEIERHLENHALNELMKEWNVYLSKIE